MTRRRTVWTVAFLSVTAAAVGMELYASADGDPDTDPWTYLIVDHLPASVTFAAIAVLTVWLGPHFAHAYRTRRGVDVTTTSTASYEPEPDATVTRVPHVVPNPDSGEPLRGVALLMAAVTAVTTLLMAFGVHLTHEQTAAVVGAVGALGALAVWLWGRRQTYSPKTVARLLAAARTHRTRPMPR